MALTDTFVKNIKHAGAAAGDKHTDGGGMYLLGGSRLAVFAVDSIPTQKSNSFGLPGKAGGSPFVIKASRATNPRNPG